MSKEKRRFDKEFKLMTVELSKSSDNYSELAEELGIRAELIYRWRREFLDKGEGSFPGNGKPTEAYTRRSRNSPFKESIKGCRDGKGYSKKGHKHLLQERWEIYQFIKDNTSMFPIEKMCKAFKVSRSGFYGWFHNEPSKRAIENQEILREISLIHKESSGSPPGKTYGSPRISKALIAKDIPVSRPRVARLMKQAELRAKRIKRFKVTTDSKHSYLVSENLLNRNFSAIATGQAWVSDITYIRTITGWLYLTVVLDLADRKVIGWALSKTMRTKDTTIAAFKMAVKNRPVVRSLIFHSDRGIQYACDKFRQELGAYPLVRQSMSRRANCWDNAVAESFFKTLKVECVYDYKFVNQQEAATTVFEYIEV